MLFVGSFSCKDKGLDNPAKWIIALGLILVIYFLIDFTLVMSNCFTIYCKNKLYMFDGILVTYAWNHFSEMHFMQLSLPKITYLKGQQQWH